jgi:hypothetical protein
MVYRIAHQVSGPLAPVRSGEDPASRTSVLQKTRMAPCRASIPLPFPTAHAGSCLVDRRAMPSADAKQVQERWSREDGTRKLC